MTNPCLKCKNKDIDKNNPECKECSLRIQYVESIGPLSSTEDLDVIKTGDKKIMEENKEKICKKCGESKPATTEYFYRDKKMKDGLFRVCKACKSKKESELRYKRIAKASPEAINSAGNDKLFNDPIVFPPNNNILISFDDYPEILEKIITAAKAEFRRPEQQILFELNKAQE